MASIKYEKIITELYRIKYREKIISLVNMVATPRVIGVQFDAKCHSTYTKICGRKIKKMRITIGGGTIKQIANCPDKFTNREQCDAVAKDVDLAIKALVHHELGHDLFTDMVSRLIIDYKEPKYVPFIHTMFNILEDQVIEYCMTLYFKKNFPYHVNPKHYFNFMVERMFKDKAAEYKDDGTQNGFLNYILMAVRIGEDKIPNRCEIFDKYAKDLIPLIQAVLKEPDATARIEKTITLCEWIIENIKEFKWEIPDIPADEKLSGRMADAPGGMGVPMGGFGMPSGKMPFGGGGGAKGEDSEVHDEGDGDEEGSGGKSDDETDDSGGTKGGSEEGGEDGAEDEEAEDEEKEDGEDEDSGEADEDDGEDEEEEDEESGTDYDDYADKEIDDDFYSSVFNDYIHDGDDHEWCIAKEDFEVKDDSVVDDVNTIVNNNIDMIQSISDYLTIFKGRIRPKDTDGFTSGRLSPRRAARAELSGNYTTRIFQRRVPRGRDADLAVYILGDGSGSMHGLSSEVSTEAMIVSAQACEWSHIPCEVATFTKTSDSPDGISFTIVQKGFEDTFEAAKPYLGISSTAMLSKLRAIRPVPTFAGNSEEVNLFYIWQKFKKVDHKTKLLFVMCDGETTGSKNNLKEVITRMEAQDGIIVIGIGIMCNALKYTYNHYKIFNSMEDLQENLAPYLIETLSQYAK